MKRTSKVNIYIECSVQDAEKANRLPDGYCRRCGDSPPISGLGFGVAVIEGYRGDNVQEKIERRKENRTSKSN